ncbi:MAG: hypothetical protein BAJATHORv1_20627 [Candidatus Thorarchaeota archaeon]|nr:MAG: hypothetical protein BAJATHORv1_20627 [Candidatus Thorarchaeota archaeon]
MRRLGNVLHVSTRGSLIIRCEKTPPIGGKVVNKKVEPVGKIIDVFGPVNSPYVAIRAKHSDKIKHDKDEDARRAYLESYIGQVMYLYKK